MTVNSNYKVLDGIITLMKRWTRVEEPRKEAGDGASSEQVARYWPPHTYEKCLSLSLSPPSVSIFALFFALLFVPLSSKGTNTFRDLNLHLENIFRKWKNWIERIIFNLASLTLARTTKKESFKLYSHRYDFDENYKRKIINLGMRNFPLLVL